MCESYEIYYTFCNHTRVQIRRCQAAEQILWDGKGLSNRPCQGWQTRGDPYEPIHGCHALCGGCQRELERKLSLAVRDGEAEFKDRG